MADTMLLMPLTLTIALIYLIVFTQLDLIETKLNTQNYTQLTTAQRIRFQLTCYGLIIGAVFANGFNWWWVPLYFPHPIIAWSMGIPLTLLSGIVALGGQKYLKRKFNPFKQK